MWNSQISHSLALVSYKKNPSLLHNKTFHNLPDSHGRTYGGGSSCPAAALQFFMTCTLFVFFCSPLLWWRARPYGAEGPTPWENHFACVQGTSQCALLPVSALSSPPSASLAGAYDQTWAFPEGFCFLEEFDSVSALWYMWARCIFTGWRCVRSYDFVLFWAAWVLMKSETTAVCGLVSFVQVYVQCKVYRIHCISC